MVAPVRLGSVGDVAILVVQVFEAAQFRLARLPPDELVGPVPGVVPEGAGGAARVGDSGPVAGLIIPQGGLLLVVVRNRMQPAGGIVLEPGGVQDGDLAVRRRCAARTRLAPS
ncbi:MAG TPA: hypothetical protein VGK74_19040 [Symbiobacteriaceae bacterium]